MSLEVGRRLDGRARLSEGVVVHLDRSELRVDAAPGRTSVGAGLGLGLWLRLALGLGVARGRRLRGS